MKRSALVAVPVVLVALFAPIAWHIIDRMGWIPHRGLTRVWVPVETPWVIGEYLDCVAAPRPPMTAPPGSPGIDNMGCMRGWEADREHLRPEDLEVNYWGRIAIPYPESAELYRRIMTTPASAPYDERPFRWRCRRNKSSLTCWAVN